MNATLSPDRSTVEPGKLLNVLVHGDGTRLSHKQFIVLKSFDYGELLEDIRSQGLMKSEDVFREACRVLIERELVSPVESCILDIGQLGRPSAALQDYYKHKLNNNGSFINTLIKELDKAHFTMLTDEGEVHLLKVDSGETLAQVDVVIDDGEGILKTAKLDLIGPMDIDLPCDMHEVIEKELSLYLAQNHPELLVKLNVRVVMSELYTAQRYLHG